MVTNTTDNISYCSIIHNNAHTILIIKIMVVTNKQIRIIKKRALYLLEAEVPLENRELDNCLQILHAYYWAIAPTWLQKLN